MCPGESPELRPLACSSPGHYVTAWQLRMGVLNVQHHSWLQGRGTGARYEIVIERTIARKSWHNFVHCCLTAAELLLGSWLVKLP
jgi:hypothetical protein